MIKSKTSINLIKLAILASVVSSCSSTLKQEDPNQRAYNKLVKFIASHQYQEAKSALSAFSAEDGRASYFVLDQVGGKYYSKVSYSLSDMGMYLDDLINAQKQLDEGCNKDNQEVQKVASDIYNNHKSMGQAFLSIETLKLQVSELCYSKSSQYEFIKQLRNSIQKALDSHSWDYFKQDSNDIFGEFTIYACGESASNVQGTREVFRCYEREMYKKAKLDYAKALEQENQKRQELADIEKKREQDKLAKEDLDGTSLLRSYCWSLQVINKTNEEVDRENKIAREVGYVNKQKMYDYGSTLVDFKDRAKKQEAAYRKLTGKDLKSGMCKDQ